MHQKINLLFSSSCPGGAFVIVAVIRKQAFNAHSSSFIPKTVNVTTSSSPASRLTCWGSISYCILLLSQFTDPKFSASRLIDWLNWPVFLTVTGQITSSSLPFHVFSSGWSVLSSTPYVLPLLPSPAVVVTVTSPFPGPVMLCAAAYTVVSHDSAGCALRLTYNMTSTESPELIAPWGCSTVDVYPVHSGPWDAVKVTVISSDPSLFTLIVYQLLYLRIYKKNLLSQLLP